MNILVTGGNGFIGSALVKALIKNDYKVFCIVRPNSAIKVTNVNILRISENTIEQFKSVLHEKYFDFVINLASYGVKRGDDDFHQMIDGNINFLANLIHALAYKPKLIINVGSCSEYGFIENYKYIDENSLISPVTLYGAVKSASTLIGSALAISYGFKFISLRLFGVYGEGEGKYRLLPYLVESLKNNKSVLLTSGEQQRDILYIDDVVNAFLSAISNYRRLHSNTSYNVCSGTAVRVKDFVEHVAHRLDKPVNLLKWGAIERPDEPKWLVGDNNMFKQHTGWDSKFTMAAGLDKAIDSL